MSRYTGGGGFLTLDWWLTNASLDFDFRGSRYYDSSLGTPTSAVITNYLTITRASSGFAKTSAGTLTSFASNVLRITDLGLLIEDARTNKHLSSQDFTTSNWALDNGTLSGSLFTAPDGTTTANNFIESSGTGNHRVKNSTGNFPTASATGSVTGSWYIKNGATNGRRYVGLSLITNGVNDFRQSIVVDTTNGTITTTQTRNTPTNPRWSVETLANGWYRGIISFDVLSGDNIELNAFACNSGTPTFDAFAVATYTGDGVSNYNLWGAQLEEAAFASSYIPTTGASATRAADNIGCTGTPLETLLLTGILSSVLSVQAIGSFPTWTASILDGSNSACFFRANGSSNLTLSDAEPGGHQITASFAASGGSYLAGVKVGYAGNALGRSLVGNGDTVATDAFQVILSSPNILFCIQSYQYLRRLTFWNSRLADATLQALTAP